MYSKMKKSRLIIIASLFFLTSVVLPQIASAIFNLSVSPYEGGFDLRFGKVSVISPETNKELVVSITSDIGKQYRIYQSILEPLNNSQGVTIPYNNFYIYGLRGTNKFGTLSVEEQAPVSMSRSIIYTSNASGESDNFTLVYVLKGPFDVPAGQYRGRISFTIEPIDSSQSPVTSILNIFADIEVESSVEVKTATGSSVITLNSGKENENSVDVLVEIKGGFGKQFRILQVMDQPLMSSEGNQLSNEAVTLLVKENKKGDALNTANNLTIGRQVVYTSSQRGDADSFVLTYSLGDISKEKSGKYRANVGYFVEGFGGARPSSINSLTLEVINERMFNLIVTPELGSSLQFRDLKPQQPPRINEVGIKINTNIGKRYQVSQNVSSLFTDKAGNSIPSNFFTVRTESVDTKGILKYPEKTEVKPGGMSLFISDNSGSPDAFKIIYELSIPSDLHAGDYSTTIVYTISEI